MARAIPGDYIIPDELKSMNLEEMSKYIFVDTLGEYTIYNLINSYDYIIGYYNKSKTEFKLIAILYFDKIENEKDLYEVDTIYVNRTSRGEGIATNLYKYFVKNHNYIILGSDSQRFGARRLWSKLSKIEDLNVSIIDFKNNEVVESNARIHHGEKDEEFDKRVWSYDIDKKHIRLILKDIK